MDLKDSIRSVPNWPIDGVIFRDLTTLMQDPASFAHSCDQLYERYKGMNIHKVAAIDARGFVFGAVLAYKLGVGFVPIRKKGKLPCETLEASYSLEYGQAVMEIHKDALEPNERVVLVDDLIATGGSINAAVSLLKQLGAELVECACIVELPDLNARAKLPPDCKVFSLVRFEGE